MMWRTWDWPVPKVETKPKISAWLWLIGSCSWLCESVYAVFLQLGVKLLLLSMDCTCKGDASKVLRDRCGVTQGILSRSSERERRFVTKRSECAGSCRRRNGIGHSVRSCTNIPCSHEESYTKPIARKDCAANAWHADYWKCLYW